MEQLIKIANRRERVIGALGGTALGGTLGATGGSIYGMGSAAFRNRGKSINDRESLTDSAVRAGLMTGAAGMGVGGIAGGAMGPKAFATMRKGMSSAKENMSGAREEWYKTVEETGDRFTKPVVDNAGRAGEEAGRGALRGFGKGIRDAGRALREKFRL